MAKKSFCAAGLFCVLALSSLVWAADVLKGAKAAGNRPTPSGAMPGLLLKGGRLLDPYAGVSGPYDVRCRGDPVVEVGPDLAADGDQVVDVGGKLVVPGLIDQHAHCFVCASDLGARTDSICSASGVTTLVDAGRAGHYPLVTARPNGCFRLRPLRMADSIGGLTRQPKRAMTTRDTESNCKHRRDKTANEEGRA